MQVQTGKSNGVREKKQDLLVVKRMVCHMYGTGRCVTSNNFFTSCELANFILTKNMTVIGTLRKNKPEVPALFLSGNQRVVHSAIFGCTNGLSRVSYVPEETRLSSFLHHIIMTTRTWERKEITNLKSSCTIMPRNVELTFWTSL
jgi:hypothetical protein